MGKVLHTPVDILTDIYANCGNSFPMHTDIEIQVPTDENLALSYVLSLRPGVGQNVAMHALPTAINYNHSVPPTPHPPIIIIVFMCKDC